MTLLGVDRVVAAVFVVPHTLSSGSAARVGTRSPKPHGGRTPEVPYFVPGRQGVVCALRRASGVAPYRLFRRLAVEGRHRVVWITHAGCPKLGDHCVKSGAKLGCCDERALAHPVGTLWCPTEPALARAIDVGKRAVGVDTGGNVIRSLLQLVGSQIGGHFAEHLLG